MNQIHKGKMKNIILYQLLDYHTKIFYLFVDCKYFHMTRNAYQLYLDVLICILWVPSMSADSDVGYHLENQ